jgi:hypothetical protein
LRRNVGKGTVRRIEPLITHRDVTTIVGILGDIHGEVRRIRRLLEDDA